MGFMKSKWQERYEALVASEEGKTHLYVIPVVSTRGNWRCNIRDEHGDEVFVQAINLRFPSCQLALQHARAHLSHVRFDIPSP